MRNKKSAFSLIEISIVVLIIGILVAGITQSSRLIASSKIATAQSLTQSAPVSANNGLMLWLETSSEASFAAAQSSDGAVITAWNDINTQSISKLFANTVGTGVTYKAVSPIGGLPSVQFSSASTGMEVAATAGSFTDAAIQTSGNSFTFFVVSDDESTVDAIRGVFQNGAAGTGFGYANTATPSTRAVTVGASTNTLNTAAYSRNPEIVSATYDGATLKSYRNGTSVFSAAATGVTPAGAMFVGSNGAAHWVGYISEIIVYNNALKDDDRKSIEQYLSKKYGIKVS